MGTTAHVQKKPLFTPDPATIPQKTQPRGRWRRRQNSCLSHLNAVGMGEYNPGGERRYYSQIGREQGVRAHFHVYIIAKYTREQKIRRDRRFSMLDPHGSVHDSRFVCMGLTTGTLFAGAYTLWRFAKLFASPALDISETCRRCCGRPVAAFITFIGAGAN